MVEDVYRFAQASRRMNRAEFVSEFPYDVLVIEPFTQLDDAGFMTKPGAQAAGEAGPVTIAQIKKRPGANAFTMITVGRAKNNDIVIPASMVSKFHAYFLKTPGGVTVTDAGSSNGTSVKTRTLEPRTEKAAVEAADEVRLGELKTTFHTPSTFYDWLVSQHTSSG